MKQTLQLRLSQHLALTPQLQQSIRLLQMSTLEFNQEIETFLQQNPLLERDEGDDSFRDSGDGDEGGREIESSDDERPDMLSGSSEWTFDEAAGGQRSDDEDADYQDSQAATSSLKDHLIEQLALTQLSGRDRDLVRLLIEALDDDGYLTQGLDELLALLPEDMQVDEEDLGIALRHLQQFDPPGVGARNTVECLRLQLLGLPPSHARELSLAIVTDHLEGLANHDYGRLKRELKCSELELQEAQRLIRTLSPRPGNRYGVADTRYVVPDVIVAKHRGHWVASLNTEAMPRLRIHRLYADLLKGQRGSGLAGQLQEAKWLIKNVQQRFDTILKVSQAIVDRQRSFFDFGEVAMRPLTLREIADTLQIHESTVSRVTTQKYMSTPRGILELKYFFGSHVATEAGGAASSTAIRALIRQLVAAEDGKNPLSDARLAEILREQGIVVARRTVAKYRDVLSIPPVNLRKSI